MYLDSIIAPSALNEKFFDEFNCLGPFGSGNNEPKFVIEDIKVISSTIIGNNHIKSILTGKDGTSFKAFTRNAKNTHLESILNVKNKKTPLQVFKNKHKLFPIRNNTKEETMIVNFQNKIDLQTFMRSLSSLGDYEWYPVILYFLFLQKMIDTTDILILLIGQSVLIFLKKQILKVAAQKV